MRHEAISVLDHCWVEDEQKRNRFFSRLARRQSRLDVQESLTKVSSSATLGDTILIQPREDMIRESVCDLPIFLRRTHLDLAREN
jgi:hypothetical protein